MKLRSLRDMSKDTICRAITIPFTPHSLGWPAFDALIAPAWAESTALANWAVLELAKHDIVRIPGVKKLPPYPLCPCKLCNQPLQKGKRKGEMPTQGLNLYRHFIDHFDRAAYWEGAKNVSGNIINAVQRKYKTERPEVIWLRKRALSTYRYPYPYPIHNESWEAFYSKDCKDPRVPMVSLTLPGGRVVLRLRQGQEFRRQLAMFSQIIAGAKKGEAAIYKRGRHTLLKLVAHFPRRAAEGLTHTMLVRTDPNALWVAEMEGRATWILNVDDVRRRIEAHRCFLQRISEDTKFEKRWPKRKREQINLHREKRCRKHNDWLGTKVHELTKLLAEYALRQKCAEVIYDDKDQSYLPKFPWFALKEKLKYKLNERGIVLTSSKSESA